MPKLLHYLLLSQGLYFVITGVWAIADIHSFMFVTGPKTDIWLVKTVSLILTVMGISFLIAVREKPVPASIMALSVLGALALLFVDVYYFMRGILRSVYLLDGLVQFIFILIWLAGRRNHLSST
jgi:hypothetical protein